MDDRKTLISSGEHIGAIRRLGDSYTAEEYLRAVEAARDAGDGERYAAAVLGVDVDAIVTSREPASGKHMLNGKLGESLVGLDVQRKADEILRKRGIRPDDATAGELLDALAAVDLR